MLWNHCNPAALCYLFTNTLTLCVAFRVLLIYMYIDIYIHFSYIIIIINNQIAFPFAIRQNNLFLCNKVYPYQYYLCCSRH